MSNNKSTTELLEEAWLLVLEHLGSQGSDGDLDQRLREAFLAGALAGRILQAPDVPVEAR